MVAFNYNSVADPRKPKRIDAAIERALDKLSFPFCKNVLELPARPVIAVEIEARGKRWAGVFRGMDYSLREDQVERLLVDPLTEWADQLTMN